MVQDQSEIYVFQDIQKSLLEQWLQCNRDYTSLITLLSVAAPLGQPGLSSGRFTKMYIAPDTWYNSLCVRENCGDLKAAGTLNVHKVAVGRLHQAFQFVFRKFLVGIWIH